MKQKIILIVCLLFGLAAIVLTIVAYKAHKLVMASTGASIHHLHLEDTGETIHQATPPGTSFFRPGGVLWIELGVQRAEHVLESGEGRITVKDPSGLILLDQNLREIQWRNLSGTEEWGGGREFDISSGGPYEVRVTVTEPFEWLRGRTHRLYVRHFRGGADAAAYMVPAILTLLSVVPCVTTAFWYRRSRRKQLAISAPTP